MTTNNSRRNFLKQIGTSSLLMPLSSLAAYNYNDIEKRIIPINKKYVSNDNINIACIGMGIMGFGDVKCALQVPGVKLVAVCDLYNGRLERAKEVFGKDIFTTKDFNKILDRKDIDAVIIATSDHWHDHISMAAMRKGKAVYCEKPMVHHINEGWPVIKVQQETNAVYQVGSQVVSSIASAKAKEFYKAGEIGKLNCIEASFDRQSALGAWEYTMPPDASEKTVDWDHYQGDAPKKPYDPKRFFWWRNYQDYGTGVAGDLFVHLVSRVHFVTDSKGPTKIYSTGALTHWKDGRDVPDVMTAIMHYPETPTTGDLSAVLAGTSPCGRTNIRIKGWMGRADQTTKVRGMFVHPHQIAEIVKRHPTIHKARLTVSHVDSADVMLLSCEVSTALDMEAVKNSIRDVTKLRGEVALVANGALANDGKVIEDCRSYT